MRNALIALIVVLASTIIAGAQTQSANSDSPAVPPRPRRAAPAAQTKDAESVEKVEKKDKREEAADRARELLERSYAIAQDLPVAERARLLPRQILAASSIDPELARQWAQQGIQFAQDVAIGPERTAIYNGAIVALANQDAELALEVFRTLPADESWTASPSDPTATGSNWPVRLLFTQLVRQQGEPGLELVRQEAQRLAQSSYYPYAAVMAAARESQRRDSKSGESKPEDTSIRELLFAETLTAYRQGARSPSGDADFARMLTSEWSSIPRSLAREGFGAAVANLLVRADREKEEENFSATVSTSSGSVELNSRADMTLLRLLPLLRNVDAELYKNIQKSRPELARAMELQGNRQGPRSAWNVRAQTSGTQPSKAQAQSLQSFRQYSQARRNPSQALTTSQALSDPFTRALTLAGAASGLAVKDKSAAASALEEAAKSAERIEDPGQRLDAAATIADAARQTDNRPALRSAMERGFGALEQLQEEASDSQSGMRSRMQVMRLIRSALEKEPDLALSFIDQMRAPELKAGLLVDAAQMLYRPRGRRSWAGGVGSGSARAAPASPPQSELASGAPSTARTAADSQAQGPANGNQPASGEGPPE